MTELSKTDAGRARIADATERVDRAVAEIGDALRNPEEREHGLVAQGESVAVDGVRGQDHNPFMDFASSSMALEPATDE